MNAQCIIRMSGNKTTIIEPAGAKEETKAATVQNDEAKEKNFSFDYSYWSFDTADENYASQERVFLDLGTSVLENAWEGYNCCIFAYGQTGSGKSYSMLGYGEDKGLIPRICEEMFIRIDRLDDPEVLFKVEVSFMEIYNEKLKDLLNPKNSGKLKVRNHPKMGVYVEDLSKIAVKTFAEIEGLMDEGSKARTVASTNMNATSSRSHAVFTIEFTHAKVTRTEGEIVGTSERVSKINLVDLAGSERAAATGATGIRLKEGANINKSLSTLGKVISALSLNSGGNIFIYVCLFILFFLGGKKPVHVPYRDSVLTWLLKESLGGNAKTIMIAALSPADVNYGETLSTLRYADNAKRIKNNAMVNEDPSSKLIRDLRSEVDALRKQLLESGGIAFDPQITKEMTTLKEELAQREKLIAEMNKTWEERLKEAQELQQERKAALQDIGVAIRAVSSLPHLINLNEDPLLSNQLIYYLREGVTKIGRSDSDKEIVNDIQLNGLSIAKEHCVIENKEGMCVIVPCSTPSLLPVMFINGQQVKEPQILEHGCRLILGNNHIFQYRNPEEASRMAKEGTLVNQKIDWNFAVKELALSMAEQQGQLYVFYFTILY